MKKIIVVIILVFAAMSFATMSCLVNHPEGEICDGIYGNNFDDPNLTITDYGNADAYITDITITGLNTPTNISFESDEIEVLFEWNDGEFNVVYDEDKCSESAKAFFVCILPYLNEHIEEKAKELNQKGKTR